MWLAEDHTMGSSLGRTYILKRPYPPLAVISSGSESTEERRRQSFTKREIKAGKSEVCLFWGGPLQE